MIAYCENQIYDLFGPLLVVRLVLDNPILLENVIFP